LELTKTEFANMVDIVDLRVNVTDKDIKDLVEKAVENRFIAIATVKSYNPFVFETLEKMNRKDDIIVVGGAGFPTGGEKTFTKVAAVRDCIADGCKELDITSNIGFIKSHWYDKVEYEMRAIVDAAAGLPVKFIIEVSYLTEDEIKRVCEIIIKAGGSFVKTGTGYGPAPTTTEHIKLIKSFVGDEIKIKAAAGIRTLETVLSMKEAGVSRFGMSKGTALKILSQLPL